MEILSHFQSNLTQLAQCIWRCKVQCKIRKKMYSTNRSYSNNKKYLLIQWPTTRAPTKQTAVMNLVAAYIATWTEKLDTTPNIPPAIIQVIIIGLRPNLSPSIPTRKAPTASPTVNNTFTVVLRAVCEHTKPNCNDTYPFTVQKFMLYNHTADSVHIYLLGDRHSPVVTAIVDKICTLMDTNCSRISDNQLIIDLTTLYISIRLYRYPAVDSIAMRRILYDICVILPSWYSTPSIRLISKLATHLISGDDAGITHTCT